MVDAINLRRDLCDHWRFYSGWIVGKELAVWQPGDKWNATAKNRLSYAKRKGYAALHCDWKDWNQSLADIHAINTSTEVRQHNPMNPAYFDYPQPKSIVNDCPNHRYDLIATHINGTIVAYAITHRSGDLINISTIIGHAAHLKDGIMLPLMESIQKLAVDLGVKSVTYGEWLSGHNEGGKNGLQYWKHSVGFKSLYLNEIT
jgi:hypothetical protein